MNKVVANLTHAASNLHFSLPVLAGAALAIAQIWLPKYATPLNATAAVLAAYGLIAADNTPSAPSATTNATVAAQLPPANTQPTTK
jgi:hypothetical protein